MNILVICQYYYPEPFRVTDICEALAELGHKVTVVTGLPNYPDGHIYPGYERGKQADEVREGVRIHRCKIALRKTGAVHRTINYFSYAARSTQYVKTLPDDFDVVFVYQLSPVMMAQAGIAYKKKYGKRLVLYCLDLWPQSLCIGGIRKDSVVYRLFARISRRIYRCADQILITSQSFQEHLVGAFGIDPERVLYLPQYAEELFLSVQEKEPTPIFHLMFAGNIGAAQSLDTVVKAARMMQQEPVQFHIIGDGLEYKRLKNQAADLPNIVFYGRKPLEEMPGYYAKADAMLIALVEDPVTSLTLPGKVQSYMAAGKAIVGAVGGETAWVLHKAQGGYCGPAGDANALAENIRRLMRSGEAQAVGRGNRVYYQEHFGKGQFMQLLAESLSV